MNKGPNYKSVKNILIFSVISFLLLFSGCGIGDALNGNKVENDTVWLDAGSDNGPVITINTGKGDAVFNIEIADTRQERAKGLMYRESLPENQGMLFVFEREDLKTFWMKNTLIPLDMVFFDNDYKIVHIEGNVQPCKSDPCATYSSIKPSRYVLELFGGTAGRLGIKKGDKAEVNL